MRNCQSDIRLQGGLQNWGPVRNANEALGIDFFAYLCNYNKLLLHYKSSIWATFYNILKYMEY